MEIFASIALACLLVAAIGWLRCRAPLGADEGYLWYGTRRCLRGEWPHRDFKSYEPGRYFWCAAWARFFGPGLASLRFATHAFLAFALSIALVRLRASGIGWPACALLAILLVLWSQPQHKQFEHACLLLAWVGCSTWLANPTPATASLAGLFLGIAALFGFNLALYAGAAFVLAAILACCNGTWPTSRLLSGSGWWLLGACAGMLPLFAMLADPEFARAFHERRIASVLRRGSSNLPLPLPWPWRVVPEAFRMQGRWRAHAWQAIVPAMLGVPLLSLLAWWTVAPSTISPALLTSAALAATAWHHGFARCDPSHLAQASGPMWLATGLSAFAVLDPFAAIALLAALCVASAWLLWPMLSNGRNAGSPARRDIGGLRIAADPTMAGLVDMLEGHRPANSDAWLFAAPAWPALYAALDLRAPAYDTFCLYPADDRAQRAMSAQLAAAGISIALVDDVPVDGREELRFSRTHPRIWSELHQSFDANALPWAGPNVVMFARTGDSRARGR